MVLSLLSSNRRAGILRSIYERREYLITRWEHLVVNQSKWTVIHDGHGRQNTSVARSISLHSNGSWWNKVGPTSLFRMSHQECLMSAQTDSDFGMSLSDTCWSSVINVMGLGSALQIWPLSHFPFSPDVSFFIRFILFSSISPSTRSPPVLFSGTVFGMILGKSDKSVGFSRH